MTIRSIPNKSIFSLHANIALVHCACMLLLLTLSHASPANGQHSLPPEVWIEMRKMYRNEIPTTTMEDDLAALSGPEARRAGPKLIDKGPIILPEIHKALLDPEVAPRHAINLFHIMQAMEDQSSVQVVLELMQRDPNTPLKRDALLTLARLPATEEAAEYIMHLAADRNAPWHIRRLAFTWFGLHHDERGRSFAKALLNDPDLEKRAAGLFVLARLADKSTIEPITQILAHGAPANSRDTLLTSLSKLVPPEEFIQRAPKSLDWSRGYKISLQYSRYLYGEEYEKLDACKSLLRSSYPGHLQTAVRWMLESGYANELRPYAAISLEAPGSDALIRNEIRKAGWKIIDTETEFRIEPGENNNGL